MKTLLAIKSLLSLKVVLMGVMVTAVAGGLIGGGLFAYFSDTETSTGNTFTAGTIDIAVGDDNPWNTSYHMEVKPCEVGLINFDIQNVGTNAVDVWKRIFVQDVYGGDPVYPPGPTGTPIVSSEPELEAEGGMWTNVHANVEPEFCELALNGLPLPPDVYPIPCPFIPDEFTCECLMGGFVPEPGICVIEPIPFGPCVETDVMHWSTLCWEPYDNTFDETVYDIYSPECVIEEGDYVWLGMLAGYEAYGQNPGQEGYWMYLGQIPAGNSMPVEQSYHLLDNGYPQNYFQGDTIVFDIELYAQQTTGGAAGEGPPPPGEEWFDCSKYYGVYPD